MRSSTTLGSLERALEHEDVACLLMEPALTNIGIVLPEPGYMDAVRELCTQYGTLLIIDETHTLSAGPGGCTAAWGLQPDAVTLGKSIGGGVPIGTYGVTASWPSGSRTRPTPTTRTPAAWAARLPATPSRSRRRAPRSARCSPTPRSSA